MLSREWRSRLASSRSRPRPTAFAVAPACVGIPQVVGVGAVGPRPRAALPQREQRVHVRHAHRTKPRSGRRRAQAVGVVEPPVTALSPRVDAAVRTSSTPSGLSVRPSSRSPPSTSSSSTCCSTSLSTVTSKLASSKGSASMGPTWNSADGTAWRASSTASALMSTPHSRSNEPVPLAQARKPPVPHPASSRLSGRRRAARSAARPRSPACPRATSAAPRRREGGRSSRAGRLSRRPQGSPLARAAG